MILKFEISLGHLSQKLSWLFVLCGFSLKVATPSFDLSSSLEN